MPRAPLFTRCPLIKSFSVEVYESWSDMDLFQTTETLVFKTGSVIPDYHARFPRDPKMAPTPVNLEDFVCMTYLDRAANRTLRPITYRATVGDRHEATIHVKCSIEYDAEKRSHGGDN